MKKHKLSNAFVTKQVSRIQSERMVDESSQVINTVTNHSSEGRMEDEDETGEEWFEDPDQNFSTDPGAGLLELLSSKT